MTVAMKPGDVLADRFELERLAASGRGAAWRARDRRSGEACALKILPDLRGEQRARFEEEMRVRASLDHPGMARYVAHGVTEDGTGFAAAEWLDGEDLRARLDRSALGVAETIALAARVADALAAAHERGLVHRSVAPQNLFLPGRDVAAVKLLDLGSARDPGPAVVSGGALAPGGPAYLAPEQAHGERDVDARADMFGLGCILYECLAGRPAFDAPYALGAIAKVLLSVPPPLRRLRREVPAELDAIIGRMLLKPPSARLADGGALLGMLGALQQDEAVKTPRAAGPNAIEVERGGMEPWGYLGDALTAAGSGGGPPPVHKLIWLVLVTGPGREDAGPALPQRVAEVASSSHASAQRLFDGSLLIRIEHERGGSTPSSHDVGVLAAAAQREDDDPAHENRRHAMLLGFLRKARMQAQGGERAARCALGVRAAMQGAPTALTLVPPSRPGEWLSGQAIDLATRLLDRGMRAGLQGIVMDEESADLLDVELFSLLGVAGLKELRGEWTPQQPA